MARPPRRSGPGPGGPGWKATGKKGAGPRGAGPSVRSPDGAGEAGPGVRRRRPSGAAGGERPAATRFEGPGRPPLEKTARAGPAPRRRPKSAARPKPQQPREKGRKRGADDQRSRATAQLQEPQRVAKLLARAGIGSRRDIERMIAEGRVALGGVALSTPATIVDSVEGLTVDGRPVEAPSATRLFLFHKPVGCLTTARDPSGRPTVFDLLPETPGARLPRLVSVGRLDMNSEGLLLLTTDGGLKRALELPASAVPRRYRVRAFGDVSQAKLDSLAEGVTVQGVRYGPIIANLERRTGSNSWLSVELTEGKNREVRRVLDHLGLKVARLIRTGYGPFELGDLPVRALVEVDAAAVERVQRSLPRSGRA